MEILIIYLNFDRKLSTIFLIIFFIIFMYKYIVASYFTPSWCCVLLLSSLPEAQAWFFFFSSKTKICSFYLKKKRIESPKSKGKAMSGLYNSNFSPARAASPQIRTTPDVDRYHALHFSTFLFFNFDSFFLLLGVYQFLIYMGFFGFFFSLSFPQSVLIRTVGRASKAWTFHASPSYMQPAVKSRLVIYFVTTGSRLCFSYQCQISLVECRAEMFKFAFLLYLFSWWVWNWLLDHVFNPIFVSWLRGPIPLFFGLCPSLEIALLVPQLSRSVIAVLLFK